MKKRVDKTRDEGNAPRKRGGSGKKKRNSLEGGVVIENGKRPVKRPGHLINTIELTDTQRKTQDGGNDDEASIY